MQSSETAVATRAPAKPMDRFKEQLTLQESTIRSLLPKGITYQKFQAIVVSAVAENMDLLDCDRSSLLRSCLAAAELGLSLNRNMAEADILKVWNGRTSRNEAQFRPRYKGLMKLALQSGAVLKIESRIVYAKDEFVVEEGVEPRIIHRHGLGNRGEMVGAYCVWKLKNGEAQFEVMSREEILAIRDRSSSKKKDGTIVGPWKTDEPEMWRKTVVRRASKYMPMSSEALRAVAIDNAAEGIEDIDGSYEDALDVTDFDIEPEQEQEPVAPVKTADAQLGNLASKVARKAEPAPEPAEEDPPVIMLDVDVDDDGNPDWAEWCNKGVKIVSGTSTKFRSEWKKMHAAMLDEAELMEHRAAAVLLKTINGGRL